MQSEFIGKIENVIKWSFYVLFFLVPLAMWPTTYELFEFNKMWLVFMISIFIAFLWGAKMIIQKRFEIRKTPLDIPILLFLASQIISTFISIDPHTSFWGYYSRFNGGLLSTIAYIFLYYAFATNLVSNNSDGKPISYKLLITSLLSGLAVTLWGLPSHFGADPTCLVFRGDFNTSCWTAAFQPTIRIFSTLGQPNWLGTYLAALIPITLGFGFFKLKDENKLPAMSLLFLTLLFFVAEIFTRSQSALLGLIIGMLIFSGIMIFKNLSKFKKVGRNDFSRYFIGMVLVFAIVNFFLGNSIGQINRFTSLSGISEMIKTSKPQANTESSATSGGLNANLDINLGGSDSGDIRRIVWQGAIELFKRNPLFGTGVETFAYSYYNVKPQAHNLTSEWDYLYNKAHNEYLNYLSTTGIFGLGTYMLMVGLFLFYAAKALIKKSDSEYFPISVGIVSGYVALLVANFFGFSVVIVNLFIFLFPIFFFELEENKLISRSLSIPKRNDSDEKILPIQTIGIVFLLLVALYYMFFLFKFWNADKKYALGYNLDHASEYSQGFDHLLKAVQELPSEDLYKDELSINMATLSLLLSEQNQTTQAGQFGKQALALSDEVVRKHPKNVVFLKTRARVAFALTGIDPSFMDLAIKTVEDARKLAPTDAKLAYNEGLFFQQKGEPEEAIKYLKEATVLKPNYADAYYSLALLYQEASKKNPAKATEYLREAENSLNYLLKNIDPNNKPAQDLLKSL